MSALHNMLQPAVRLANRQLAASTPGRELAAELDGKRMAVRVRDTGLAACLAVHDGELVLADLADDEPDVAITGSLLALTRLSADDGAQLMRDGRVELTGDATVAERFQQLLHHGRPDWEESLSGVVGDSAAQGIGEIVRNMGRWSRNARQTVEQNIGEYLQEERRALPSRYEVERFAEDVSRLRDDVARAEARLNQLEAAAEGRD